MINYPKIILNSVWSLVGVLASVLSGPLGWEAEPIPPALVVRVRSFWWMAWSAPHRGVRAIAIGNVVVLGPSADEADRLHELIHVRQAMHRPLVQPLLYQIETWRRGYKNNRYELEAYERAGNRYLER